MELENYFNFSHCIMGKTKTTYSKKALSKRVSKIETIVEKIDKTFDQRQHDSSTLNAGIDVTWLSGLSIDMATLCPTNQAATGIDAGTVRIGDKITLSSISIKGEIRAPRAATGTEDYNKVRMMLVRFPKDGVFLTAPIAVSSVLQNYPTVAATTVSYDAVMYSPYKNVISATNAAPLINYDVLYDKVFNLQTFLATDPTSFNNKNSYRHAFSIKKRWKKGLVCQYSAVLDAVPSLNSIHLLLISDSAAPNHPTLHYASRFKYLDA